MARRSRPPLREGMRFPQSPEKLASQLFVSGQGTAHYRQTAAADSASSPQGSLSLAAMPGYTLASVDQVSVGALVPAVAQSLLAGLGLRRTSSLRMEALGVEVAEVPFDTLIGVLRDACDRSLGVFAKDNKAGKTAVDGAAYVLFGQRRGRSGIDQISNKTDEKGEQRIEGLQFYIIRKVFYLRGIRFMISDGEAAAAFAQVALRNRLPEGEQAPKIAPLARSEGQDAKDDTSAAIARLEQQVKELGKALDEAAGGNLQAAAQIARATATGIELVHVFDRPLAFGYQPIIVPANVTMTPAAARGSENKPERNEKKKGSNEGRLSSDGFLPICKFVSSDEQ